MIKTVVKVGGSLGRERHPRSLMQTLCQRAKQNGILVIPGGGPFADVIREHDDRLGLNPETAHWMAILAMDQYAHLLASLASKTQLVKQLEDAEKAIDEGQLPILLSYDLLRSDKTLSRSWDVTSDSIAAWVAGKARANQLILLKSLDGLTGRIKNAFPSSLSGSPSKENNMARRPFCEEEAKTVSTENHLLRSADLATLQSSDLVDSCFCRIVASFQLEMWIVNGQFPERVDALLSTGETYGTQIKRCNVSR